MNTRLRIWRRLLTERRLLLTARCRRRAACGYSYLLLRYVLSPLPRWQVRARVYLFLWSSSVRAVGQGRASRYGWATAVTPPLLVLWPVLWLLVHR